MMAARGRTSRALGTPLLLALFRRIYDGRTMGSITPYGIGLPNEQPAPAASDFHDISALWGAFVRRWRLFACIVLGFVFLVGLITIITPKTYTTTVRLIAGNPAQPNSQNATNLPILNALLLDNGVDTAETFATLAQQETVASDVIQTLHLKMDPLDLLQNVSVTPTTNTSILNLSVTWRNREKSATVANAFADSFIRKERGFVQSQAVAAIEFLSVELPHAEEEMQRTGKDLASFQAANGFVDANNHTQDVVAKQTALEGKIDTVMLDSREAKALLDNAAAQLARLPATVNNAQQITVNPVLTDLRTKLEQVDLQLAQAQQQYTDQHPQVISLKRQRTDLLAEIAREPETINSGNTLSPNPVYQSLQQQIAQYRQRIDGDQAQLALLERERKDLTPLLKSLPQESVQLATLQQRAKLAADVYNALQQKYDDATVAKSTAISDISIIQPATPDSAVVRPKLIINLLAAIVVGLLIASIAVFILDLVERPVRESGGPGLLGLPVIARIPSLETTNKRMLPWLESMTLEAFLQLCVSLKLKSKRPLRTLAVTSPSRNDGKSTIAFNLAKAMANLEPRILLIDADLRRPALHDLAGCSNRHGLSDVLERSMDMHDAIQQLTPTLDLLAAGHSVENPVGLVQSSTFEDLMRDVSTRYNMVIVDTPALSCVTDGFVVSARADASVLVIAANTTAERDTREAVSQFASLGINNLVGIVLNRDRKRMSDYGDYFARRTYKALPGSSI
jgi:succinoglycan biosynthesis transport protein ExoP